MPKARTAGGGDWIKRAISGILAVVLALVLFLSYSGTVAANHSWATQDLAKRISLLDGEIGDPCVNGDISYDAETTFWVSHGWNWAPWSEATPQERRAFMHPSMTFVLYIDGDLQPSSMFAIDFPAFDLKLKVFQTEVHGGLPADTYTFRGEWYLSGSFFGGDFRDSVLVLECDVDVILS